jgi:choline dehydrogenase-like flavoprotein
MLGGVARGVNPEVDVLVIGSGPVGSAFARAVHERAPEARIVMLEAGPQLTDRPGAHVKNLVDSEARHRAQVLSEGPDGLDDGRPRTGPPEPGKARPGTALVDPTNAAFPEGAMSTNVGGMGAHWTCACPRPGDGERIPFLPDPELDELLSQAERFLGVRRDVFPDSAAGRAILDALSATYDRGLPSDRRVDRMPLACGRDAAGQPYWTGSDLVLGPLAEPAIDTFELRADTICRRLEIDGRRVVAAEVEHRPTARRERIAARTTFVACDALRTPQLLWASGIRLASLGGYLNDHIQVVSAVKLDPASIQGEARSGTELHGSGDPIVGVFWVPFSGAAHPFHGQVMHLELSPIGIVDDQPGQHVVGLGWFVPKEIRAADRVVFSDRELDAYGMPAMRIEYGLTDLDRVNIDAAIVDQQHGASALGEPVPGRGPTLIPAGSSLHYQGTTRMGEVDDGESVCDPFSRVWGFDNLLVGGNGVIPTRTASNPTLTSVALAIRAAGAVA